MANLFGFRLSKPSSFLAGVITLCGLLVLVGCGGKAPTSVSSGGITRFNSYCEMDGLQVAARETIFIVDGSRLKTAEAAAFRSENPGIIETIDAYMNEAYEAALLPRERIRIVIAGNAVGGNRLVFEGCLPRLSAQEAADLNARKGALANLGEQLLEASDETRLAKARRTFWDDMTGAVINAARTAPPSQVEDGILFIDVIKAAASVTLNEKAVSRLVIVAPVAARTIEDYPSVADARRAGLDAATEADVWLNLAEVVVSHAPGSETKRQFADAFLVGSGGHLSDWSEAAPTQFAPPPVSLASYSGDYSIGGEVMGGIQLRLARDASDTLTQSWVVIGAGRKYAVPLFGRLQCREEGDCRLVGERQGFAQAWSVRPGGDPEFQADMPFSGLRDVRLTLKAGRAEGGIFDPEANVALPGQSMGEAFSFAATRNVP